MEVASGGLRGAARQAKRRAKRGQASSRSPGPRKGGTTSRRGKPEASGRTTVTGPSRVATGAIAQRGWDSRGSDNNSLVAQYDLPNGKNRNLQLAATEDTGPHD